jgi:SAM-dependent methyltransferase/FKBP-type peptidyl-prolyl cis-trans isomerase 2
MFRPNIGLQGELPTADGYSAGRKGEDMRVDTDSKINAVFQLQWQSASAGHTEMLHANKVNVWRDLLPEALVGSMMGAQQGDSVHVEFAPGEVIEKSKPSGRLRVNNDQFDRSFLPDREMNPRVGRFYPRGLLRGVPGIFRVNMEPFRCRSANNGHIDVDFNHPLADRKLSLTMMVGNVERKENERGGTCTDWVESVTAGPGMQARIPDKPTDYFSDNPFQREDERPDPEFYARPRMVQHLDDTAVEMVQTIYGRHLKEGMRVLDLMGSWQSHIPQNLHLDALVGVGLNEVELKRNPRLTGYEVKDLNADPQLPFSEDSFDAAVCTVSVEYLSDPMAIFREIHRVLSPGGVFVVTFSNRWFPPKAIRLWQELHEFERMGLVLEYFLQSAPYRDLHTYSVRGLPRPRNDRYYPTHLRSDPVYAVWGRKQ